MLAKGFHKIFEIQNMFVKKDLRKIPEILSRNEENDEKENQSMNAIGSSSLTELKLARRQGEFGGNLKVLCDPIYSNALANLTKLSLYDCGLHDLKGIGMLGECSRLQQLNIGSNDFTAYVAKDGSSKDGYISVNHEANPGGVSIVDASFDNNQRALDKLLNTFFNIRLKHIKV